MAFNFQVSQLGHLYICEFHDHSTMIPRYSISQVRIYRLYPNVSVTMFIADVAAIKVSEKLFLEEHDFTLRRKSSYCMLGSPNQLINMEPYPSLAKTPLSQKVWNGKNIENF